MAYFRRIKGGWRAEVERRGVRLSASFPTKGHAQAWAAEQEAAILKGALSQWPDKTLAQALDRYTTEVSPGKRGARTELLRSLALQRDFPELAAKVLHEITAEDLARWRDARLARVTRGTVQRDINMLRNVWSVAAREWRWCGLESPWKLLRMPGENPGRGQLWGWREIRAMMRRCDYVTGLPPRTGRQSVAWAFLVALRTGMRAGEILQLTVDDVDLERRVLTIRQHKTMHLTGKPRRIPLLPRAAALLAVLVADAAAAKRKALWTLSVKSLDTLFRRYRDAIGLRELHFHDSRATALTMLARRMDVLTLQRISGHRRLDELLTYYRESEEAIARRLTPRPGRPPGPRT